MIKQVSFEHGWFYHYRVHNRKVDSLTINGLSSLKDYLHDVFEKCPHNYFRNGPRGSALKFKMPQVDIKSVVGHEVSSLAKLGLEANSERYRSNHSKVQVFMLENDDKTLAAEVPIWLLPEEFENFRNVFKCKEALTGHIDVLRVENDLVWVWDYKPCAQREEYATAQTYFYSIMLSKRTGIPLERFRCGWFDTNYAFVFKPEKNFLKNNEVLQNFI